jgi:hypothetical protein
LTAPCSVASADITVKMVVPTLGSRLGSEGVRAARGVRSFIVHSELVVVGFA